MNEKAEITKPGVFGTYPWMLFTTTPCRVIKEIVELYLVPINGKHPWYGVIYTKDVDKCCL